jgi:hypothetical protein
MKPGVFFNYIITLPYVLLLTNVLRVGNKTPYWTKAWLRKPALLRKSYDSIFLLDRLVQNFLKDVVMSMQMVLTRSVHFGCFLIIRHHHEIVRAHIVIFALMTILFAVTWLIFMQGCALLFSTSNRVIRSWKKCTVSNPREKVIWMKIRKSIRPISFKMGHYYVVKPMTVVAMAETYLKGTIRLLLTFSRDR